MVDELDVLIVRNGVSVGVRVRQVVCATNERYRVK